MAPSQETPLPQLDPQQWRQLFALLDTALELPAAQRDDWVDSLECSTDVRRALRDLLTRHAAQGTADFLRSLPRF